MSVFFFGTDFAGNRLLSFQKACNFANDYGKQTKKQY